MESMLIGLSVAGVVMGFVYFAQARGWDVKDNPSALVYTVRGVFSLAFAGLCIYALNAWI